MIKIKEWDKTSCNLIAAEVEKELAKFKSKYGITVKRGNGKFSSTNFTLKIDLGLMVDGKVVDKYAEAWKKNAYFYGMNKGWLGKTFVSKGKTFKITGWNKSAHKYPVIAETLKGKAYKFTSDSIKEKM